MAQVPVSNDTFIELNKLKADGVMVKGGKTITWDEVISSAVKTVNNNKQEYNRMIKKDNGKLDPELKEKLEKGQRVSSEELEEQEKEKRFVG